MANLNNKQSLIHAIEDYDVYSLNQRKILALLVNVSVKQLASVSIDYITKTVRISKPNVYQNITKLIKDKTIIRIRQKGTKVDSYELCKEKLDYILQIYQNKKNIENN